MSNRDDPKVYHGEHAIVIGGGFGGLLAARVLSDYFKNVTIIERDTKEEINIYEPRKGVPQGRHIHILMSTGARILRDLFPKLDAQLVSNGAYRVDILNEMRFCIDGWKPHSKSDKFTWAQSRPFLEENIRKLVQDFSNIEFLYSNEVQGLLSNFKEKRITGVRINNLKTHEEINLYADLIVDTSGRNTHCPEWLENLGYLKPTKEEINVDLFYLSRIYRWPDSYHPNWKVMIVKKPPPNKKAGTINAIENDSEGKRWVVTLIGQHGDFPPNTEEGYLEFARHLEQPDIYDIIKKSTPLTPFSSFKFPTVRRYCYEEIPDMPVGFIAIGDSLCSFSPIYGIGMSTCAQTVEILQKILSDKNKNYLSSIRNNFFRYTVKPINNAWEINVGPEYMFSETQGKRPFGYKIIGRYRKLLLKLSNEDLYVWSKILSIISLEKHPINFLHPAILFRALLFKIRGK